MVSSFRVQKKNLTVAKWKILFSNINDSSLFFYNSLLVVHQNVPIISIETDLIPN